MTRFYGLTGGIACGKSTVAEMFAQKGVPILDLDQVGHRILEQNLEIQQALVKAFGTDIIKNNNIHRPTLAKKAFQTTADTQRLNRIMHPAIMRDEQAWRKQQTAPFAIIEASVLIESGGTKRMDATIVVLAEIHLRRQRARQRGIDMKQFDAIIRQQCSDEERIRYADMILDNHGDMAYLQQQVTQLYQQLS